MSHPSQSAVATAGPAAAVPSKPAEIDIAQGSEAERALECARRTGRGPLCLAVLDLGQRAALQDDFANLAGLLADRLPDLLAADRAVVLLHDKEGGGLWTERAGSGGSGISSAALGCAGFVVRNGVALRLDRAAEDPRYDRAVDDPEGTGRERLLAVPVVLGDRALAALLVVRSEERPAFADEEAGMLHLLADHIAPWFRWYELRSWADESRIATRRILQSTAGLFREEAVELYVSGSGRHGDPLRLFSRWPQVTFWALVALFVSGLVLGAVAFLQGDLPIHLFHF